MYHLGPWFGKRLVKLHLRCPDEQLSKPSECALTTHLEYFSQISQAVFEWSLVLFKIL